MICDFVFEYFDFLIVVVNWFEVVLFKGYFEVEIDDYVGELEIFVMMYYYLELVNLVEVGDGELKLFVIVLLNEKVVWVFCYWDKVIVDSGVGNLKKVIVEKGECYVKLIVEKFVGFFEEMVQYDLYE